MADIREEVSAFAKNWWIFLVTGIAWLLVAVIVLRFNASSLAMVGFLIGLMFLGAAVTEVLMAGAVSGGWKILHIVLAIIFFLGAMWGFFRPINTAFALASILGFLLAFGGAMAIIDAIVAREESDLWWIGLVAGILMVLLAIWVAQDRSVASRLELILLWVGFFAIFRGITEIVMSFRLHGLKKGLNA